LALKKIQAKSIKMKVTIICKKEIIIKYLKENGFDGLAGDNCGCGIDELCPCDGNPMECSPAIKTRQDCEECKEKCDASGESEFCYKEIGEPIIPKMSPCPNCHSNNIKCHGSFFTCCDCGHLWGSANHE
jgi:hypothetical protein